MGKNRAPLVEAIREYAQKGTVRFHVPGHKGRGNVSLLSSILPFDLTEIPGLDDLHHPEEAIQEAQLLAAEAFGAEETFFLVGGSTAGNIAMIMVACKPGEEILIQRNVHKSVINGLILSQARPIYLMPELDEHTGLPLTVSLRELERMLRLHPMAKAVFLSNPNYYGMGMDLHPYADLCSKAGIPLLVDEAHGAHFGFVQEVPASAIQAGASAAVQSTHKMLPALTMSSMLHVKGSGVNRDRLRRALSMIQSSSPSYPLMASLDYARLYMVSEGKRDLQRAVQLSKELTEGMKEFDVSWLEAIDQGNYNYLDPLKVTLRTANHRMHGFALKEYLEERGIFPELADQHHVLLALSVHTSKEDVRRTLTAIKQLGNLPHDHRHASKTFSLQFSREVALTPHEAFHLEPVCMDFKKALGKISAEMIVPYPPGIPAVNPGERLTSDIMDYLRNLKKLGCRFHGLSDHLLDTILVFE